MIDFLNQTIENLNILREASVNDNLANAELHNNIVVPNERKFPFNDFIAIVDYEKKNAKII